MNPIHIYLSGSIKKGRNDSSNKSYWVDQDIFNLKQSITNYELVLLNPASRSDDLSDSYSTFGRDLLQVYLCDILLVDLRNRKGIGIGAEMMFAKKFGIPTYGILEKESHYRKSQVLYLDQEIDNWVHPFVFGLCDQLFTDVPNAGNWINKNYSLNTLEVTDWKYVMKSLNYYLDHQLKNDVEMKDLIASSTILRQKLDKRNIEK